METQARTAEFLRLVRQLVGAGSASRAAMEATLAAALAKVPDVLGVLGGGAPLSALVGRGLNDVWQVLGALAVLGGETLTDTPCVLGAGCCG